MSIFSSLNMLLNRDIEVFVLYIFLSAQVSPKPQIQKELNSPEPEQVSVPSHFKRAKIPSVPVAKPIYPVGLPQPPKPAKMGSTEKLLILLQGKLPKVERSVFIVFPFLVTK